VGSVSIPLTPKWLKSSVEKLSKKSLNGVSQADLAGITQQIEPF
jgi:hypothetical protein